MQRTSASDDICIESCQNALPDAPLSSIRLKISADCLHVGHRSSRITANLITERLCVTHGSCRITADVVTEMSVCCSQVIQDNLATDQFFPQAHKSALVGAKQWLAQQWPHHFKLKPLQRQHFLAPQLWLTGADNNTSNPVHKREKHGVSADALPVWNGLHWWQEHVCTCLATRVL